MVRSVRKTRKCRSRPCDAPAQGLSAEELARTCERMELYDSLTDEEAALVQEYGLAAAINATRQFYGRPAKAREYLEAQRKALQVQRMGNITAAGPAERSVVTPPTPRLQDVELTPVAHFRRVTR